MNSPHNEPLCAVLNREAENHCSASFSLVTDFSSWPTVGKKCAVPIKREFVSAQTSHKYTHRHTHWMGWKEALSCWDSEAFKMSKLRRWISVLFSSGSGSLPPWSSSRHSMAFCSFHSDRSLVDHPDLREENSIQAGVHTSPPLLVSTLSPSSFHFPLYGRHSNRRQTRKRRHCGRFLSDSLSLCLFSASLTLYSTSIPTKINVLGISDDTINSWSSVWRL